MFLTSAPVSNELLRRSTTHWMWMVFAVDCQSDCGLWWKGVEIASPTKVLQMF